MQTLIFVYNADAGVLSAAKDWFHKIVSPHTYACSLCAVTYGNLGMRPEWRRFVKQLAVPVRFLHRDELQREFPGLSDPLPAAYAVSDGQPTLVLDKRTMDACTSVDLLMAAVSAVLEDSY